jgi:amino-acid N-acetyltransferase
MTIRRATVADVPAMSKIINDCAEFGQMLPRSLSSLYENVREFHVAEAERDAEGSGDSPGGGVVGVCGLSVVWANLAECCALAVAPDQRGKGLGRRLVEACVEEARLLGIRTIMTLTYERVFFERLGFAVVDRQQLPLKVWSECVRCPKNQACDEIAMTRVLEDVPELAVPRPAVPPPDKYIVPIIRAMRSGRPVPPEDDD